MKSLKIFSALIAAATLASCAATDGTQSTDAATSIGMNILKTSIKQTCQTQLTNHQYWKLATVAMSEQSKANISNTACGCVADKAPESVSMTELATAAIDPSARMQIAQKIVVNSLQTCVAETLNSLAIPAQNS